MRMRMRMRMMMMMMMNNINTITKKKIKRMIIMNIMKIMKRVWLFVPWGVLAPWRYLSFQPSRYPACQRTSRVSRNIPMARCRR